jgi:hypothetical protein
MLIGEAYRVAASRRMCQARRVRFGRRAWLKGSLGGAGLAALGSVSRSSRAGSPGETTRIRAATGANAAAAPRPLDLDVRDLRVEGDRALGRRFLLLTPNYVPRGTRVPLLVLLHGLGETIDETLGVRAWLDRYGLGTSFERLRRPPVVRTSKPKLLSDERAAALNADLMRAPFEGFAIACPFTPKIPRAPEFDAYATWIVEIVLPRARAEAPILADERQVAIDGCSLGGFVGMEVFMRYPKAFGAWGGVQAAVSEPAAPLYAERLAGALRDAGTRPIHIETSTEDVFRKGNEKLAAELERRGVSSDLLVIPGWHDQPWLSEAGTIEMLLWHDRRFRAAKRPA